MAYQVLARKWRPKAFADLVGQEHVVKALRNALDEGRLHHAYLLTGTRGVGKTTIARILAKSLNCVNADHGEPCGVCESCTQIDSGRYVDLLEIDAASNTGIDNIREVLENAQYAPTAGKYKVYIIDEVHMLSKSAFNAMLKTLEEPPEHVKFILATTDPHKVPVTVLSRCLQFVLRNMTAQQVADHLAYVLQQENIAYEASALQLLGRAAAGSMRDALSLLDQAIAMGSGQVAEADVRNMIGAVDKHYLYELLQGLAAQNGEALLAKAQEMAARAIGFDSALAELALLLQRLALIQAVPAALPKEDPEYAALSVLSQAFSGEQIQLYYQCAIHGKQDLSLAPDEYAGFVMTLLRMLAFAPLAAASHPSNGVIEHTQLHDAAEGTAVKKPQTAVQPEAAPAFQTATPAAAVRVTKQAAAVDDTPPWEDVPAAETANSVHQAAGQAEMAESVQVMDEIHEESGGASSQQNRPSENGPETQAKSVADADIQPVEPAQPPRYERSVPSKAARTVHHADAYLPAQAEQAEETAYAEAPSDFADMAEVEYPAFDHLSAPPPPVWAEDDDDSDDDEQGFAPLPPFAPENWAGIVKRFAKQLGAAQMLAQNAAWVSHDAESGLMMLSLTDEARATTNKERLDKIQNTLAHAYGRTLKLQTCPWQDDAGWETPVMRAKRLQEEGRRQAQAYLEADVAAQQILQTFEAEWLPDTLVLKTQV